MMFPKNIPIRDAKHLRRVASLPCMITGQKAQAHHLLRAEHRGTGTKTGDNWVVPLSPELHAELHRMGNEIEFFKKYGWDYEDVKKYATKLWEESCLQKTKK